MRQPSELQSRGAPLDPAPSILTKAFDILDVFDRRHFRSLTLSQLARYSDLPKSTVHRVIRQLVILGAVEHHNDGYRVGPRITSLSMRSLESVLAEAALRPMNRLHRETRQPVFASRRYGATVRMLEQVPAISRGVVPAPGGDQASVAWTAEGRVLLAFSPQDEADAVIVQQAAVLPPGEIDALRAALRDIRARGAALNETGFADGLKSVAVPVMPGGRPALALSIAFEEADEDGARFVEPLRSAALEVAEAIKRHCACLTEQLT